MNLMSYSPRCYSKMEMESMETMVMTWWMMVMMIPMKSSVMTMAMISPLREGISPADFSLPESFFSLCGFRLVEAAEYFLDGSPRLRVSEG